MLRLCALVCVPRARAGRRQRQKDTHTTEHYSRRPDRGVWRHQEGKHWCVCAAAAQRTPPRAHTHTHTHAVIWTHTHTIHDRLLLSDRHNDGVCVCILSMIHNSSHSLTRPPGVCVQRPLVLAAPHQAHNNRLPPPSTSAWSRAGRRPMPLSAGAAARACPGTNMCEGTWSPRSSTPWTMHLLPQHTASSPNPQHAPSVSSSHPASSLQRLLLEQNLPNEATAAYSNHTRWCCGSARKDFITGLTNLV